jgi:hypothetical protein
MPYHVNVGKSDAMTPLGPGGMTEVEPVLTVPVLVEVEPVLPLPEPALPVSNA